MLNRWMIDFFGGSLKNVFMKTFFKKPWGPRRTLPRIQPKSFRKQWKKEKKKISKDYGISKYFDSGVNQIYEFSSFPVKKGNKPE